MGNSEVSQFKLASKSASAIDHVKVLCTKSESTQPIEVPAFLNQSGELCVRVPGNRSDWKSIALSSGEALNFDTSWSHSIVGLTGKPDSSVFHDDNGEDFLWLGDTVWFGLTDRISNTEWKALMQKRTAQGFNVMQVVSGLLPEAAFGDKATLLEGVTSWKLDKSELEKKWWDAADIKVIDAVQAGQMPALVGAWSYYILQFGAERLKNHWTEMIARWGAFPTFWCVGGEVGLMEYKDLFSDDMQERALEIQQMWKPVVDHVRATDPWHRPITVHPCPAFNNSSTEALQGDSALDFVWLQTGHADVNSTKATLTAMQKAKRDSKLPVLNSEVCYEGIAGGSPAMIQRYLFWTHMLLGAAGHTYGAQGIWAFHDDETSPGAMWGWIPWQEAIELPGAQHLGIAAKYLRSLGWNGFTPAPDSINVHADLEHTYRPWAGRTKDQLIVYFPTVSLAPADIGISTELSAVLFSTLEKNTKYNFEIFNPRTGDIVRSETITSDDRGEWNFTSDKPIGRPLPTMEDWIVRLAKIS
ncbi:MAG: DUF4038 domain-containing protein [Actinobacteria bacterium]|uniref:Unannotated protein n=1 Tax=freshwater metagenome TaxID=449393 RepID=A0A6J6J2U6_9ZZZZ|nr:DUF4038 domain-containing protein [Actinomycetota bacterium]